MLDILLFRQDQGGNPELVRESQRRRYASVEAVDKVIELDKAYRQKRHELDLLNRDRNKTSEEIGKKKKAKEDTEDLVQKVNEIKQKITLLETECKTLQAELHTVLITIGNIVHESVPVSNNEENNAITKTWGEKRTDQQNLWHHHELLYMIDGFEQERGVAVAGHRGYFLKGKGVELNLALISYGVQFLAKKGYIALQPPYFMNKDVMAETAQLSQFDEELYKVIGEDEKYLIATSEQPISALHRGEWLEPKSLPIRYVGTSSCFRKEAGSHGKDTWGIFRVHQFDKVEQFCITNPEDSWNEHEQMLNLSEEFYQSLGIPYRVVTIVSGELNNAAAKKYDLEGWFPGFGEYRELVSCSNCTDYQARRLEVRFGTKKQGDREKKYVHMLNSTLCATTRTICAILENYQTDEGVRVPEPLKHFLGVDLLPFKNAPKKGWKKGTLPQKEGPAH